MTALSILNDRDSLICIPVRPPGESWTDKVGGKQISNGKTPVHAGWQKSTPVSLAQVKEWLSEGKNIGILPGSGGLAVLDVESDCKRFARERFPDDALIVATGGGGFHVYLELDVVETLLGKQLGKLSKHRAELFGRSGYVLFPPSKSSKGSYSFFRAGKPISDPEVIKKILEVFSRAEAPEEESHLEAACQRIRDAARGERHDTFIKEGSEVWRQVGLGEITRESAEEALEDAFIAALPDEVDDLERCLGDVKEYGEKRARESQLSVPAGSRYQWLRFDQLPRKAPKDDIVEGMFGPGEVLAFAGRPGSGKSTLMVDLCTAIATDRATFLGQKCQRHGLAFLAAGEGVSGLIGRFRAAGMDDGCSRVGFMRGTPNLASSAGVEDFIASVREMAVSMDNGPVRLVVIDTLSQSICGQDENSNGVMALVAKNAGDIAIELSCAVVLIHHGPKDADRGLRGGGALFGALDAVFYVERLGNSPSTRQVTTGKQRDRDDRATWAFELEIAQEDDSSSTRVADARKITPGGNSEVDDEEHEDRDRILQCLHIHRMGQSLGELIAELGISKKRLRRLLKKLKDRKMVEVVGAGKSTKYRLTGAGHLALRNQSNEDRAA